jgi:hypothetical protein
MRGQTNLRFNPSDNCVPPKSKQQWGIRTILPPLIPSGVVEFMREVLRALLLAATRCAYALESAELQCVVPRKITSIDLKPVHPAEQQVGVDALIRSWLGHKRRQGKPRSHRAATQQFGRLRETSGHRATISIRGLISFGRSVGCDFSLCTSSQSATL